MKKVIAGLLSVAMIAAMAGCNKTTPTTTAAGSTASGESKPAETQAPSETTTAETTVTVRALFTSTCGHSQTKFLTWLRSISSSTLSSVRSTLLM